MMWRWLIDGCFFSSLYSSTFCTHYYYYRYIMYYLKIISYRENNIIFLLFLFWPANLFTKRDGVKIDNDSFVIYRYAVVVVGVRGRAGVSCKVFWFRYTNSHFRPNLIYRSRRQDNSSDLSRFCDAAAR